MAGKNRQKSGVILRDQVRYELGDSLDELNKEVVESYHDLPLPSDDEMEPVVGLCEPFDAYQCKSCAHVGNCFKTLINHHRKLHPDSGPIPQEVKHLEKVKLGEIEVAEAFEFHHAGLLWTKVSAQQWEFNRGLFCVRPPAVPSPSPSNPAQTPPDESDSALWASFLREDKERLEKQAEDQQSRLTGGNNADDTTQWHNITQWPVLFDGKSVGLISGARYVFMDTENQELYPDWSVKRAKLVCSHFDMVLHDAKASLQDTNDTIRLRGLRLDSQEKPYRRPLGLLQQPETERKYSGHWKGFLLYCLRVSDLPHEKIKEEYGIVFTEDQVKCMKEIKALVKKVEAEEGRRREQQEQQQEGEEVPIDDDNNNNDNDNDDDADVDVQLRAEEPESEGGGAEEDEQDLSQLGSGPENGRQIQSDPPASNPTSNPTPNCDVAPSDQLREKIFQLSILFITQRYRGVSVAAENGMHLVHFCGVLGFNRKAGAWRRAGDVTPMLACLLWICRVLLLEYTIPKNVRNPSVLGRARLTSLRIIPPWVGSVETLTAIPLSGTRK